MLDLALYCMGYPEPVSVVGSTYKEFGSRGKGVMAAWAPTDLQVTGVFDVDDLAVGLVKFANGATLFVEASWAGHQELGDDLQLHLFGRDGGARMVMPDYRKADSLRIFTDIAGQPVDIAPRFHMDDEYTQEVRHFIACIRAGKETMAPGEQGVTLMRIIDALYESAASGKQVYLTQPAS
jgi:predicted dehydrogenase